MPGNNAWNGKWTGDTETFTVLFSTLKKYESLIGGYGYDFGDGWRAWVDIRPARHRERVTNRFAGYEWMLRSIKKYGSIRTEDGE
jgi:hypothetical protein